MSEHDLNKKLILEYFRLYAAGDLSGRLLLLHEDLVHWINGGDLLAPISGTRTKDEYAEFARLSAPSIRSIQVDVTSMAAEGDQVACEIWARAEFTCGDTYDARYMFMFRVENNLIISLREYPDTLYSKTKMVDATKTGDRS